MSTNPGPAEPTVPVAPTPAVIEPAVTELPHATIEVDDQEVLDANSSYDAASIEGSTQSLNSGIFKYRRENGRTYHALKDGDYVLPNDEEEQDRLDLQNHVFMLINNGKLCTAPVDNPARVLDIGTGTGIWAIDMADAYPGSHIIGNDLSPIQPGFVPSNCQFEVDDVSSEWLHKPFNFIHARMMGGSLLSYKDVLASAHNNLAPGGWYEAVEFESRVRTMHNDATGLGEYQGLPNAPSYEQWETGANDACERIGRKFNIAPHLKDWMAEVGFVNIVVTITPVPIQPWPKNWRQKEIGLYQQANFLAGLDAYGAALFTRVLGWSAEEFAVLSARAATELRDSRLQLYSNVYQVYGQKAEVQAV